jgi:hypothetical protein
VTSNLKVTVERVNGVIADVLRSFASRERARRRLARARSLIPLVDFAINYSASTLGSGYTPPAPLYADRDRGQHLCHPLLLVLWTGRDACCGPAATRRATLCQVLQRSRWST